MIFYTRDFLLKLEACNPIEKKSSDECKYIINKLIDQSIFNINLKNLDYFLKYSLYYATEGRLGSANEKMIHALFRYFLFSILISVRIYQNNLRGFRFERRGATVVSGATVKPDAIDCSLR